MTTDNFGCNYNENIRDAKDIASTAVLLSGIPLYVYIIALIMKKYY